MNEMKFILPENLDIEEVITKNREAFYRYNLKIEKLIFICDALLNCRARNRKEMEESNKYFAPLSTEILQEVVHDYDKYLKFLVDTGIFLTDNHFIVGEKCRGYRFNTMYEGQRIKEVKVSNYSLKKARRRAIEKRNEQLKKSLWGYSYLTKWWDSGKLKIDLDASYEWLEEYEREKIQLITSDCKKKKEKRIKRALDTTSDFKLLAWSINNSNAHYSFSGEGHRFYNPITNLKKELRNFLTYDEQPLVEIDMKNSQPFLSTILFSSSFWSPEKDKKGQKISLKQISNEIYKKIKNSRYYNDIITLRKSSETLSGKDSDLKKYIDLVVNGGFYEYIQEHFTPIYQGSPYQERFETRDKVKEEVLRIFYVENEEVDKWFYLPCKTFRYHFPEVSELFKLIKGVQSNYLPIILQRIESFLILDIICRKINTLYPEIPLFTIHDSIITTMGNESIVEQIMASEIENWTGYKAALGKKHLSRVKIAA